MTDFFIFTEVIRCGIIGRIALKTYHKFHEMPVHIYGTDTDLLELEYNKNNILHIITDKELISSFDSGHKGTAMLWAKVILENKNKKIIHFDSDVVFRGDIVNDIIFNLKKKDISIVGPIRNYKNNPNNRDDVRHLPDITQTYCFGFDASKIKTTDYKQLSLMCQGMPTTHPVIDFFDPVAFEILSNCTTDNSVDSVNYVNCVNPVFIIDCDIVGGCNKLGIRDNLYKDANKDMDFGHKIVHFSSVGSGLNFWKMKNNNVKINVPAGYVNYALKKFQLYITLFYKEQKDLVNIDNNEFMEMLPLLQTLLG